MGNSSRDQLPSEFGSINKEWSGRGPKGAENRTHQTVERVKHIEPRILSACHNISENSLMINLLYRINPIGTV